MTRRRIRRAIGAAVLGFLLLAGSGCESRIEAYPDELAGIGVVVRSFEGGNFVLDRVLDGGPGAAGGLEGGDRLLAVDGGRLEGKSLAAVVSLLRGREGSEVVLKISRGGELQVVTLTRRALARAGDGEYRAR